jgi:hypothetical protein
MGINLGCMASAKTAGWSVQWLNSGGFEWRNVPELETITNN